MGHEESAERRLKAVLRHAGALSADETSDPDDASDRELPYHGDGDNVILEDGSENAAAAPVAAVTAAPRKPPANRHQLAQRKRRAHRAISLQLTDASQNDSLILTIGGVSVAVGNPAFLENVPAISGPFFDESQEVLRHYRWMLQKDTMGQDIFFIGPPGNLKRKLVLRYAQLAQREVEYVALSKDLTDGDLKQRREIKDGSAFYTDQACVRAAIHGRILILDGVEKAERNVLPILNNLLENREMSLDDGRFLVHPSRYDKLAATHSPEEMKKWKLVRASDKFIVIALGLPVPKYEGHPLDPPLRSRFQARNINVPSFLSQMQHFIRLCPNVPQKTIERLVSVGMVLRAESNPVAAVSIPEFPTNMDAAIATLRNFPEINLRALLDCVFPFPLLSFVEDEQRSVIEAAYQRFYIRGPEIRTGSTSAAFQQADIGYRLKVVNPSKEPFVAPVEFDVTNGPDIVGKRTINVPAGNLGPSAAEFFVQTEYHSALIATMLVCHVSTDICIIGEKGAGKSALLRAFTRLLGYTVEFIPLYKDMSARDLLQRRSTNSFGDTIWEHSPLVKGALAGSVVVLDQIEVLSFGALASLQRLISERAATLPDGTQLLPQDRYVELSKLPGYSQEVLTARKVYPVHPSFRVIAIARPTSSVSPRGTWLNPEITSMFMFVPMRPLAYTEEMEVIQTVCPGVDEVQLKKLLTFANLLRTLQDDTAKSLASALSTRQLIRIARRLALYPNDSLHDAIFKAALGRFLPSLAKQMLESLLAQNEFPNENKLADVDLKYEVVRNSEGVEVLRIGEVSHPVATDTNPLLIPDIVYHDNVKQTEILREMLKDYTLGEHLLLIGNQGVGKNKLTDRFLQLLKLPREYIQLHRDTTVQSLTSTPTIVGGVLVYEDSPLVRAVKEGYVLVVDEADKAPTHVTSVLKSLVEDGEMVLSDGRRILSRPVKGQENYILIHKSFRMIVLANRPGFPFLGNDFYREIGDVFATHCVDNPDSASEIQLLKKYAPSVAEDLLIKLSNAFTDLRRLVDEGLLNYPYSTRELVSVVKHLEAYPGEGLSRALGNVFDFDSYESDVRELLLEILAKHGIPTGLESDFKVGLGETWELPNALSLEVWNRKPVLKRDAVKCVVDRMQLHTRGGWPFAFGQNKSDLERVQGRTLVFSELVYSFRLPAKGEGIDILCSRFKPALTYALSSNPITLHVIDQRHLQSTPVDLYEYFPLQTRGPPGIELFEISQGKIGLHNPQDRMLLILNFQLQTISSISLPSFDPKLPSVANLAYAHLGVIVFHQPECHSVLFVDLNSPFVHSVTVPVKISSLHATDVEKSPLDLWIIQEIDNVKGLCRNYLLSKESKDDVAPSLWEPLVVSTSHLPSPVRISSISPLTSDTYDFPKPSKPLSLYPNPSLHTYGAYAYGLPESLMNSTWPGVEVLHWPRPADDRAGDNGFLNLTTASRLLRVTKQIATVVPADNGKSEGWLEVVDPNKKTMRRLVVPLAIPVSAVAKKDYRFNGKVGTPRPVVAMSELPDGNLVTLDLSGTVRVWQVATSAIETDVKEWKRLVGTLDAETLSIVYGGEGKPPLNFAVRGAEVGEGEKGNGTGKGFGNGEGEGEGEGDGNGTGNGQGDGGGTGGGGGASGGGGGGESTGSSQPPGGDGRKEGTVDLNTFNLRTINDVPKEVSDAQREMHSMAMKKRLDQLEMSQREMEAYTKYYANVQREIRELRVVLEATEAKNKERIWLRNQTTGDVDDTRLIEGVTGEKAVYKRRGDNDNDPSFQQKPKKMHFVFDLSASMMRFNGYDSRLDRSLECALLIMEAFKSFEHKFKYRISGHSGDGADIEFVTEGKYPKNEKDMFQVLAKMHSHAQYCLSGDNTLAATSLAVKNIVKEEADDYFVVILSDANITQYNINPAALAKELKSNEKVNAFMVFIGSLQDQADQLVKAMPGSAYACLDTKELPKILKTIFMNSMLKGL